MLSELSSRSRPLALVVMGALLALPMRGRAQELEAVRPSAFDLLARSPELGGSDIPRDLPGRVTVGPAMRPAVDPPEAETSSPDEHIEGEADFPLMVLTDRDLESGSTAAPSEGALTLMPASSTGEPREFKVLPAVVSVVPGLLFHGLAPAVAGDGHTAKRLFALEGTGLGLIALGGVPIALTGASRKTIAPLYAVTLAGFSVFGISALANLYSVASPAFDPGVPPPSLPPLELEMGYQYVSDTSFDYDHFVSLGAVARFDEVQLRATARLAPDEGNTQVRVGGAYRLLGVSERRLEGSDGSSLDAELMGLFHRFPTEGFAVIGGDVGLRGRYAMARVSPSLAGSFAEVSLGMSMQGYSYFGPVDDGNLHTQLLFTFGYGVWLGRGGGPFRGEAMLYYDHRKDDFAGGVRSLGGGVVGNFGLRGRVLLTDAWGVAAEAQAGGALVGRLSLIYAFGGDL
ncbi:hypothetical protein SAMN05443572_101137 [Myxococcus fulvus]|uniref:Uncharacterized protein n=1 Tax=Myxococcus fulvus TaxID=33 RepID=A0A511T1S4_MYXFU|nr:hypothetical protein [Myxococcus fulvus]AKF79163.1 hypothetical protein MFUL124B02_01580 [Myxococcus fulvus 124B02]GEN07837.1 hypothetical protein MFU01_28740 [Myxococcus fulvus]SES78249.1 hypothetical protein SAMN05443572_101137 [Myxococcus fulvus]